MTTTTEKLPDRSDIRFGFGGLVIKSAAKCKAQYHRDRQKWWEEELSKAHESLRESVQLRDQAITGGTRKVAVFDEEKQMRVNECENKINLHQTQAEDYEAWVIGMDSFSVGKTFNLSISDIKFFGLGEE